MMTQPLVLRTDRGKVAVLALNRPDQRNALSRALVAELHDHLDRIAAESSIRSVVVTGVGGSFCAGMDLREAADTNDGPEAEQRTLDTLTEFADVIQRLHTLDRPTIAAVNGDCLAGGAGLMAACDLAVASAGARIGYPEVLRGLVPAIVLRDLSAILGSRRTRQLVLGGEPITAAQACQWGLVNHVTDADDCLDEAIQIATGLHRCGPRAVAALKRLLDELENRPPDLRAAAAVSAQIRLSDEAREGIRAFIEKRPPHWEA
jgi:methylglutaconyl-CoA hydratase